MKTFLDCETEDKQLKLKNTKSRKVAEKTQRTLGQVITRHPWIQKKEKNKLGQMIRFS